MMNYYVVARAQQLIDGPRLTCYTLWRNIASTNQDLILFSASYTKTFFFM